ncbi:hypothetical protein [Actinophytocola xinjiangensis]|uniref:hypothetical protein n=1 Tax=Actinophytocola xinjiangensis TaxID=485602 RepID=UPI000A3E79FC|nr:hypothetical protein [Actinophytocola xinjiangensis]
MRTRRILVITATALAAALLATTPAHAGGWSETVLDPPPGHIERAVTYTFGFWVLQHGSYPIKAGNLGEVTLTATDDDATRVTFPATESATAGHYSAEVVFPHDGEWQIGTEHSTLMPDPLVAVVTVPGTVDIMPSEVAHRAPHDWGTVRPSFPPTTDNAQVAAPEGYNPEEPQALIDPGPTTTTAAAPTPETPGGPPIELLVAGGLALLALTAALARHHRRRTRA